MVVYIIGPSRSGKTTVTKQVVNFVNQSGDICGRPLHRIDLDGKTRSFASWLRTKSNRSVRTNDCVASRRIAAHCRCRSWATCGA